MRFCAESIENRATGDEPINSWLHSPLQLINTCYDLLKDYNSYRNQPTSPPDKIFKYTS